MGRLEWTDSSSHVQGTLYGNRLHSDMNPRDQTSRGFVPHRTHRTTTDEGTLLLRITTRLGGKKQEARNQATTHEIHVPRLAGSLVAKYRYQPSNDAHPAQACSKYRRSGQTYSRLKRGHVHCDLRSIHQRKASAGKTCLVLLCESTNRKQGPNWCTTNVLIISKQSVGSNYVPGFHVWLYNSTMKLNMYGSFNSCITSNILFHQSCSAAGQYSSSHLYLANQV